MVPVIEGVIARRILLNFRADPALVQAMLPKPFAVDLYRGHAIVGICLIHLRRLRPKGLPGQVGISSENMAHRVAVRFPLNGEMKPGVFIWRRETDQKLAQVFGGRLFPGVYHPAQFAVEENAGDIQMDVKSKGGSTDVKFFANGSSGWLSGSVFKNLPEASAFFEQGSCGFSCSSAGDRVEGMELKTRHWTVEPLEVRLKKAAFYENSGSFPKGSIEYDCGLIMRNVEHEWHEIEQRG